jgi:DNA sulfur modification protein DndD
VIFTSLSFTNFGVFRGRHTVDLTSSHSRPVVLFGGLNGAGKTTVLEAIRLCLYGPGALGTRPSRDAYAGYLVSRIHASPSLLLQPTFASIAVGFQYSDVGRIHEYTVTRAWERATGDTVAEHFTLTRDGAPLDDLGAEHWQDFIEELIPLGVSQLFFFDGERIQQLAEDSSDQQTLADSMKGLLGLDLINRLQADLGLYRSRLAKPTRNGPEAAELDVLEQQIGEATLEIERSIRERDAARRRVSDLQAAVARVETKLQSEGGAFARNREGLVQKQAALRAEFAQHEEVIRQRCPGTLPFALIPKLCHQLEAHLLAEEQVQQRLAARDFLDIARRTLHERLKSADFWGTVPRLSPGVRTQLRRRVLAVADEALTAAQADEIPLVHQLAPAVRRQLLAWLTQATAELPETMKAVAGNIERVSRELHRVEAALQKVPADDVLRPLLQELRTLYAELATASRDALRTEEKLTSAQAALGAIERRRDQVGTSLASIAAQQTRMTLAAATQHALEEYKDGLLERRIGQLRSHVTECFNKLCRKHDALRRITVDPRDFSVTLWDRGGRAIAKSQLSAGEKQIYAVSMLWALARTSGRPLPMIIDTPLARLDSAHRKLLLQHYFPRASHQILLLSTDTEIDQTAFDELRPYIARSYQLEFDATEGATTIARGYFWPANGEAN